MTLFRKCDGEFLYYDKAADLHIACEVRISDDEIVVSYDLGYGPVVYKGKNQGTGHFELTAESVSGRATLHRFPESSILVGYWHESRLRGMWRIRLVE